jgi:hypothetical protein
MLVAICAAWSAARDFFMLPCDAEIRRELLLYKCSVKLDHWTVELGERDSPEGIEVIAFEVGIVIEKECEGSV